MSEELEKPSSSGKSNEIWVTDFTQDSATKFRDQVLYLAEKDSNIPIIIRINSYGGFVDCLASMLTTMDEVPNRFITIAQGCAMSCGAILLSHGDLRFCSKYSRIMIHNVSSVSWGDVYSMKAGSDEGMRLNKVFMGLLAKNCGLTYEQLQNNIKAATDSKEIWMSPDDALKFHVVDRIGVPELVPIVQWACETVADKERLNTREPRTPSKKKVSAKKTKKRK